MNIAVSKLLEGDARLKLEVIGSGDLSRLIEAPRIQKPGLALAGWPEQLHTGRVLVLGGTEVDYLGSLAVDKQRDSLASVLASHPACIVVCRGLALPASAMELCRNSDIAVLSSELITADFITKVTSWMSLHMAPRTKRHGVLVDILGLGVLLMGKSGIGKSETALDLVLRGHRLVADDVVSIRKQSENTLLGSGESLIRYHMEIRGIGIISLKDLFGIYAVRENKKIELAIELVEWVDGEEYERLGVDTTYETILGVSIPRLRIPVRPGRNMAGIVEVAARNHLLKLGNHDSAKIFNERLRIALQDSQEGSRASGAGTGGGGES